MSDTPSAPLSPEAAAKIVGLSRFAIVRAIKAGKLRAIRDNNGHWKIDPEALELWRKNRPKVSANTERHIEPHTDTPTVQNTEREAPHTPDASIEAQIEAAVLRERLAVKEQALTDQREAHAREVGALQERLTSTEARLDQAQTEHREQLAQAEARHAEQLEKTEARHSEQIAKIEADHAEQLTKAEARLEAQLEELRQDRAGWQKQAQELTAQIGQRKRRWWHWR